MKEQEARKAASTAHCEERNDRKENWIHTGIVVKVLFIAAY